MNRLIVSTHTVLKPSAHGWRLTYYDSAGDPVASFWATTHKGVYEMARPHHTTTV